MFRQTGFGFSLVKGVTRFNSSTCAEDQTLASLWSIKAEIQDLCDETILEDAAASLTLTTNTPLSPPHPLEQPDGYTDPSAI